MEILDIVDEHGNPTGKTVERKEAHRLGIRHRTSHVWIVRKKEGRLQILLQKRSEDKDSYPGCYDISSAGHIPAGVDFIPSALRELQEELGVSAKAEELIYCGQRSFRFEQTFHGELFCDRQISNVYLLWLDREPQEFVLQASEVSEVCWFDFEDCQKKVKENEIPHCIYEEELRMVAEAAGLYVRAGFDVSAPIHGKREGTAAEISEEVGYHDKAQFYRIFKKNTGVTPKEYREGKRNAGFNPTAG